jgi:SAM-dependent methyltransferase
MHTATSLPYTEGESDALDILLSPDINKSHFQSAIRRLHTLFKVYVCTCPVPLPASGLIITTEIRTQCERYLPIVEVAAAFNQLYSAALTYPPIFSSTPFHDSLSWADTFAALPTQFQLSANPARLLESLLDDVLLLSRFLFASFLPGRFYGSIGRYPGQQKFVREWLTIRKGRTLHCLDVACGTGEETYGLALLLSEEGLLPEAIRIDGWTLEPLEVWAATYLRFPHDRRRETLLRGATAALFQRGYGRRISFRCQDILTSPSQFPLLRGNGKSNAGENRCFDLILCNGLLGGPIIHEKEQLNRAVGNLSQLLAPGGILLAADNFHGGWKQKCPQTELRASFETHGLKCVEPGGGLGGLKL